MIDAARALRGQAIHEIDAAAVRLATLTKLRDELTVFIEQPAAGQGSPEPSPSSATKRRQSGMDHGRRATSPESAGSIPALRSTDQPSHACPAPDCPRTFGSAHALRIHRARGHQEPSERSDNTKSREKRRQQREADAARAAAAEAALMREEASASTARLPVTSTWLCGRCPGRFSTEELRQAHYDATGHGSSEPILQAPVGGIGGRRRNTVLGE